MSTNKHQAGRVGRQCGNMAMLAADPLVERISDTS